MRAHPLDANILFRGMVLSFVIALTAGCVPFERFDNRGPRVATIADPATLQESISVARAAGSPMRGSVLLLHGLNTAPAAMDSLAQALNDSGFDTYRIALAERGDAATLHNAWNAQLEAAWHAAKTRTPDKPIYSIGYSLGALVTLRFVAGASEAPFARAVLLAPPLSLRASSLVIKFLCLLRSFNLSLPSLAPREYRRSPSTSLHSYSALFMLQREVPSMLSAWDRMNIPLLALLDPEDELVSFSGTSRTLQTLTRTSWELESIYKESGNRYPHHLMLDYRTLGDAQWVALTSRIVEFLR